MNPLPLSSVPFVPPASPAFSAGFVGQVVPVAASSVNYIAGGVVGPNATYSSVFAWTAYLPGRSGWDTRGARGGRVTRYLRGLEDVDQRRG
jgi:hypothetical protein